MLELIHLPQRVPLCIFNSIQFMCLLQAIFTTAQITTCKRGSGAKCTQNQLTESCVRKPPQVLCGPFFRVRLKSGRSPWLDQHHANAIELETLSQNILQFCPPEFIVCGILGPGNMSLDVNTFEVQQVPFEISKNLRHDVEVSLSLLIM